MTNVHTENLLSKTIPERADNTRLRIIHTADWHLGHHLYKYDRLDEHRQFLQWLLQILQEADVDVLIVAGDVFDSGNPPAEAQALFYKFLADIQKQTAGLTTVVIGGNHDSAMRLDAPAPLAKHLHTHFVGGLPYSSDGLFDADRAILPLVRRIDPERKPIALCAMMPYLRVADLVVIPDQDVTKNTQDNSQNNTQSNPDPIVASVRHRYQQALQAAARRAEQILTTQNHQEETNPVIPVITTGHCFVQRASISERSERKILLGNQHPLPSDLFVDVRDIQNAQIQVVYTALGHMHLAQSVGDVGTHVYYSGSPIPLSIDEKHYPHQVKLVDLCEQDDGTWQTHVHPVRIPRFVDVIRIPSEGGVSLQDALALIEQAKFTDNPFVEVRLSAWMPQARDDIARAFSQKKAPHQARLVHIQVETASKHEKDQQDSANTKKARKTLHDVKPEEVFIEKWKKWLKPQIDEQQAAFEKQQKAELKAEKPEKKTRKNSKSNPAEETPLLDAKLDAKLDSKLDAKPEPKHIIPAPIDMPSEPPAALLSAFHEIIDEITRQK